MAITAISLFSGCGGMDLGAERSGARIVFGNDVLPDAAATHRALFPGSQFVEGPVGDVSHFPSGSLVLGGYPCQSFTLGGRRRPSTDKRSLLYVQFARCVDQLSPKYFVAENVTGMKGLEGGKWLQQQLQLFVDLGKHGYRLTAKLVKAEDFGVPQRRRRLFIVGVRRDLNKRYRFPSPTHSKRDPDLKPLASHGDAIAHLPLWPDGEFYERPHDPEGHWAWWYMSRNRKARWDDPSFTIVSNPRHITLHPASETMSLTWSNLADGFKQRWDFSGTYEHTLNHPERKVLDSPRRLSWREAAVIQTFPDGFEPSGDLYRKFEQIGNAVPPLLAEAILRPIVSGSGLIKDLSEEPGESNVALVI